MANQTPKPIKQVKHCSRIGLDNLETSTNNLRNLLVLMRQQAERIRNVAPLLLRLASGESGREFLGQLPGMFILITGVSLLISNRTQERANIFF